MGKNANCINVPGRRRAREGRMKKKKYAKSRIKTFAARTRLMRRSSVSRLTTTARTNVFGSSELPVPVGICDNTYFCFFPPSFPRCDPKLHRRVRHPRLPPWPRGRINDETFLLSQQNIAKKPIRTRPDGNRFDERNKNVV